MTSNHRCATIGEQYEFEKHELKKNQSLRYKFNIRIIDEKVDIIFTKN